VKPNISGLRVPLEDNNVALVILTYRDFFTPVVGINHTSGGWFLNYYINKEHPWFGTEAHDSRHPTLIAARLTGEHDVYSVSEGAVPIDDRKTPEELPARSITGDLMLPLMHRGSGPFTPR
jgi:hypothetical protein